MDGARKKKRSGCWKTLTTHWQFVKTTLLEKAPDSQIKLSPTGIQGSGKVFTKGAIEQDRLYFEVEVLEATEGPGILVGEIDCILRSKCWKLRRDRGYWLVRDSN